MSSLSSEIKDNSLTEDKDKYKYIILGIFLLVLISLSIFIFYKRQKKIDCDGEYEEWTINPHTNTKKKNFKINTYSENNGKKCSKNLSENNINNIYEKISNILKIDKKFMIQNFSLLPESDSLYLVSFSYVNEDGNPSIIRNHADVDISTDSYKLRSMNVKYDTTKNDLGINASCSNNSAISDLIFTSDTYYYTCTNPDQFGTLSNVKTYFTKPEKDLNDAIRTGNIECQEGDVLVNYKPIYDNEKKECKIEYKCAKPLKKSGIVKNRDTGIQWNYNSGTNIGWYDRNRWNCGENFGAINNIIPQIYDPQDSWTAKDKYGEKAGKFEKNGKEITSKMGKSNSNTTRQTFRCVS